MNRTALRWFATVWVICLIVASLQPLRPPDTSGETRSYKHELEHVIVFGATGLILLALARDRREEWAAAGKVMALAIGIEVAQLLIYRMPFGFEWWDVREDTIGMILAMLLARSNYFQSAVKTLNS